MIGGTTEIRPTIYDDITQVGLIRREMVFENVEVPDYEHPNGTGKFVDDHDVLVLDSFKLK